MPCGNSYRMLKFHHIFTQMKLRSSPLVSKKKFVTVMEFDKLKQNLIAHSKIVLRSISKR
jgi:hypothetical protein